MYFLEEVVRDVIEEIIVKADIHAEGKLNYFNI